MGNTLPQTNPIRSETPTKNGSSQYSTLKKSRSLREYNRSTSLINSSTNSSTRKNISLSQSTSKAPTDGEIIDICALRCVLPLSETSPEDGISPSNVNNEGEKQLIKQLDYIRTCIRKDKGLFGKFIFIEKF
jgi:hypothetical protein